MKYITGLLDLDTSSTLIEHIKSVSHKPDTEFQSFLNRGSSIAPILIDIFDIKLFLRHTGLMKLPKT